MAISSPLQSKVPTGSTQTIKKLQTILLNRTKVRREIFQQQTILQNRRIENERRKQREDELEAPNLVTKPRGAAGLIAGSAKGFFERLVGFLSYLTAGWIINNLPTWISMGKEFIARTQQMGKILGNFVGNVTTVFTKFTTLLGASLQNLMTFDFSDTSGRVSTAFDDLNLSVENWGTDFENAIKLITTPLSEGIASGEDARPLGTENTNEGAYETTAPYSGSGQSGQLLATNAKSTYYDPSLGGINASGAKTREGLPATSTGEGYKPNIFSAAAFPPLLAKLPKSMTVPTQDPKFPGGRTLKEPFNIIVTNSQGKKAVIRVNDVGPGVKGHSSNHMLDLSVAAKNYLGTGGGFTIEMAQSGATPGPLTSQTPQQSTPTQIVQVPPGKINPIVGDRLGAGRNHGGTDLAVNNGTPLRAVSDGVIVDSDYENGWGNFLVMKDDRGIYHLYGHMQSGYKRSGPVKRGEVIGKVGMTGRTSGPHLHWEAGTGWNGGVITGRFDPLNKYSKFAPFNTSYSESKPPATAQSKPQTPTPAQITPTGTPQNPQMSQSLAPERTGPTVIVSQNPSSPAQQMMSSGGGSSGGGSSQISEFTLLNNFIKNKLLLDLAYL